jgi:hypothetical protein
MDKLNEVLLADEDTGLDELDRVAVYFFLKPDPSRTLADIGAALGLEEAVLTATRGERSIPLLFGDWGGARPYVYHHRLEYHDCLVMYIGNTDFLDHFGSPGPDGQELLFARFGHACETLRPRIAWISTSGIESSLSWVLETFYDTSIAIGNPMRLSTEVVFEALFMDGVFETMYDRHEVIDSRREELRMESGLMVYVPDQRPGSPEDLRQAVEDLRRRLRE